MTQPERCPNGDDFFVPCPKCGYGFSPYDSDSEVSTDPRLAMLRECLQEAGWRFDGRRDDVLATWVPPNSYNGFITLPLEGAKAYSDYEMNMERAIRHASGGKLAEAYWRRKIEDEALDDTPFET